METTVGDDVKLRVIVDDKTHCCFKCERGTRAGGKELGSRRERWMKYSTKDMEERKKKESR